MQMDGLCRIWKHGEVRGHCLVYGVATLYGVALQRLYVRKHVRWMTFGDVVQRSLFRMSTSGDLARSPLPTIILSIVSVWDPRMHSKHC